MYRGQLFQDDPVKCHKQKEIMDLSDLATGRSEGSLAAILLTDVSRAITLVENWESGSMRANGDSSPVKVTEFWPESSGGRPSSRAQLGWWPVYFFGLGKRPHPPRRTRKDGAP